MEFLKGISVDKFSGKTKKIAIVLILDLTLFAILILVH